MAYSDFDLRKAVTELGLSRGPDVDLFPDVSPIEPSAYLREWLAEFGTIALQAGTEAGRREAVIFPVLAEAKRHTPPPVHIASGVTFDVDPIRGLVGFCDYLLTRSAEVYYVVAPVFAAVEAKKEDLTPGLGQCAAELVAIRQFNEREQRPSQVVYGCVTNGETWRFLKLDENALVIDKASYAIGQLPKILGILVHVASA